jgi:hypothetical protein
MQESFAAQHPWYSVARLAAKSHFPTIEVPELIAAAVERFLGA